MLFRGGSQDQMAEYEAIWDEWCAKTRRRPQLRDAALRLIHAFENHPKMKRWPKINEIAPEVWLDAAALLTPRQQQEVIDILRRVWYSGQAFYVWAKRQGITR